MKIHLFHTNDVHSAIENYIRLGHALRRLRTELEQAGDPVLTLDIGDVLDRVRPETEVTLGRTNARLMRALGYDAWVFGNNEGLTIPLSTWPDLITAADTALLTTNLRDAQGQRLDCGQDVVVHARAGLTIGLLGVTENFQHPYRVQGVRVLDPIETVRDTVALLRERGCDVVVVLSHLGLWRDRQLAAQIDGVDLILGAHSHHFMDEPEVVAGTPIFQAGKHALAFGHTTLVWDEAAGRLDRVEAKRVDVDPHGPMDASMLQSYQIEQGDVNARLSRVVFALDDRLPVDLQAESAFGNVLVDALFDAFPGDLGIMFSGALTASLLPGRIEVRHLLAACSTPTRPLRLTLLGRDILAIINKSVQSDWYDRQGIGFGFRGSVIGYLTVANATVELDRRPAQPTVLHMSIGDSPLIPEQTYRVVTCEYLWLSSAFEEFHRATDVQFERPLVRDVLVDYLAGPNDLVKARHRRYI